MLGHQKTRGRPQTPQKQRFWQGRNNAETTQKHAETRRNDDETSIFEFLGQNLR